MRGIKIILIRNYGAYANIIRDAQLSLSEKRQSDR